MINVPDHVENEDAYIQGAFRRMAKNAARTTAKRIQNDPSFRRMVDFVEAKSNSGSKFFVSMYDSLMERGKWSEGQEAAIARIIEQESARKAEMRVKDAGSEFVGTVGGREVFTLTLTGYTTLEGTYGISHLHFMKDAAGNCFVYKGTNKLDVEKGEQISVKATVKSHDERDGVKQTKIARPAKV